MIRLHGTQASGPKDRDRQAERHGTHNFLSASHKTEHSTCVVIPPCHYIPPLTLKLAYEQHSSLRSSQSVRREYPQPTRSNEDLVGGASEVVLSACRTRLQQRRLRNCISVPWCLEAWLGTWALEPPRPRHGISSSAQIPFCSLFDHVC